MGSWYVERLLLEKETIENSIVSLGVLNLVTDMNSDEVLNTDFDFDNETYNDLIDVLSAIKVMYKNKILNDEEIKILETMMQFQTFKGAGDYLNLTSITVSKAFSKICGKIGFFLGDKFTNIGFVNYLKEKYNFNDYETVKIYEYLGD